MKYVYKMYPVIAGVVISMCGINVIDKPLETLVLIALVFIYGEIAKKYS